MATKPTHNKQMARGLQEKIQYYIRKGEHEEGDRVKANAYFSSLCRQKDNKKCKIFLREIEDERKFILQAVLSENSSEHQEILDSKFKEQK